jgi:UDPglucose 6-dehydrogenase
VAVQTPHRPEHEGVTPLLSTADFDYSILENTLQELLGCLEPSTLVAVVSTVAPGTFAARLDAVLRGHAYCYNPSFIAMGTVVPDILNPEFTLIGAHAQGPADRLTAFWRSIHNRPILRMSIPSAEIVKMLYNTAIGVKISFGNLVTEWCEAFGGHADDVVGALKQATDRLVSARYMEPGVGDGGNCHPRDNIVLSHLAKKMGLSFDLGGAVMQAREKQAQSLINRMLETGLPLVVLGRAFKPETNIQTGSHAVLVLNLLSRAGYTWTSWDPYCDERPAPESPPSCFLIGTKHPEFATFRFPVGSVVIDPHGYIEDQEGVQVVRLGRRGARLQ